MRNKNQPMVSTNSRSLLEKIVNLLKDSPEGLNPKTIAFYLVENQSTVKSAVIKMEKKGILKKDNNNRGIYSLVENGVDGTVFNFKFQNAILTCIISKIGNKDFWGPIIKEFKKFILSKTEK